MVPTLQLVRWGWKVSHTQEELPELPLQPSSTSQSPSISLQIKNSPSDSTPDGSIFSTTTPSNLPVWPPVKSQDHSHQQYNKNDQYNRLLAYGLAWFSNLFNGNLQLLFYYSIQMIQNLKTRSTTNNTTTVMKMNDLTMDGTAVKNCLWTIIA